MNKYDNTSNIQRSQKFKGKIGVIFKYVKNSKVKTEFYIAERTFLILW